MDQQVDPHDCCTSGGAGRRDFDLADGMRTAGQNIALCHVILADAAVMDHMDLA